MIAVRSLRPLRRTVVAMAALATMVICTPHNNSASPASSADEVTSIREARLRKLHLVRPDLIHFPISFDAVC